MSDTMSETSCIEARWALARPAQTKSLRNRFLCSALVLFAALTGCSSEDPNTGGTSGTGGSGGTTMATGGTNPGSGGTAGTGGEDAGTGGTPIVDAGPELPREDPFVRREMTISGLALSYSPYRDGQQPDGAQPNSAQLQEDLEIISQHWQVIRTYGSGPVYEDMLRVIDENDLPLQVFLCAWLYPESPDDAAALAANKAEVDGAIKLANAYPDIVKAIIVGNEVLVDWSTHKVPQSRVIQYVRRVRAETTVPVTVTDNYVWWRTRGATLAQEVDFISIHTYPLWEKKDIDLENPDDRVAIDYTIANYEGVADAHPDMTVLIGEAGWASMNNYNVQIVPGAGSEEKQKVYYDQLMEWVTQEDILTFTFEAFDENWKGGPNPAETEKHWGLFNADRTPKLVVEHLFPDLKPSTL